MPGLRGGGVSGLRGGGVLSWGVGQGGCLVSGEGVRPLSTWNALLFNSRASTLLAIIGEQV